ncbi:restriction endonuclease subunit S [Xanthomonas vasicola]|uniref:restriction endonuclease subunit S n=1 Tax=Xanthomonas vasicola TaxID=56459 RepID=UPI000475C311|nr:restriction endonuclease subunit S [Xanthomonas vasicola]KFA35533.1 Type I restriction enzyme StySPI specificity protein [Xanthomonas vasicola pv. vasculorum NCPPB 206]MDO6953627.1 restriction endonuclease subunit S [Xanthomonas vasicola]
MVSELPQGWTTAPLGLIGSWGSGGTPSRGNSSYFEGHIPWAVIGDLKDGTLTSTQQTISKNGLDNSSAKLVPADALLVAMYGSIGKLAITGIECATNQAIAFCVPDTETIALRYLFYSILQSRDALNELGQGAGQQNISQTILKEFKIPLAPLAEQKRIAQKLDALLAQVDTLKARIDAIPALLKRFRQSVLESAFSGELTAEWRQLHPDTKAASITDVRQAWRDHYQRSGRKFVPPNLDPTNLRDDLPPTWQATQIGIIFDVFVGATPARDRTDFWKGSISWVSSAEVAFCKIRSTKEKITEAGYRATSTNLHPPGTVMLAMIGQGKTRGQPAILAIDACHNQNTAALRVHDEYCVPEYLYYYLWGKYEETRRFGGGNNQQALNKKSVQSLPFPLAPLAEQTEIVRRVEQLFAYADQLEAKVAAAQQRIDALTQSLLAKAFRGELVPQDPSDEPASVLLERIRAQRAATPKPKRGRKAATS